MITGPYALGQQMPPFGTLPLPKELQRMFITHFKRDTDIHSLWPSHEHPACVGECYEAQTQQSTMSLSQSSAGKEN